MVKTKCGKANVFQDKHLLESDPYVIWCPCSVCLEYWNVHHLHHNQKHIYT